MLAAVLSFLLLQTPAPAGQASSASSSPQPATAAENFVSGRLAIEGDSPVTVRSPLSNDERRCADTLVPAVKELNDTINSYEQERAGLGAKNDEWELAIAKAEAEKISLLAQRELGQQALKAAQDRADALRPAEAPAPPAAKRAASETAEKAAEAAKAAQESVRQAKKELAAVEAALRGLDRTIASARDKLLANKQRIRELTEDIEKKRDAIDPEIRRVRGKHVPLGKRMHINRQFVRCERGLRNARIEAQIEAETRTFRGAMRGARAGRCATALCWGPSYKFAFEPLAELPIGKTFGFPNSGLARYVNSNDIQVSFNAGIRFWMAWDWVSVSVYLSKPILHQSEAIHVSGSNTEFSTSQVRRPYPGVGIGLFGDLLWLSFDYDTLRNGNSGAQRAPEFRPNEVVSHAYTFTVAIAPIAGVRNGLGLGTVGMRERRLAEEKEAKDKEAKAKEEADRRAQEAAKIREELARIQDQLAKAQQELEETKQAKHQPETQPESRPEGPAPSAGPP